MNYPAKRILVLTVATLCFASMLIESTASAELTAVQIRIRDRLYTKIREAGVLYTQDKFNESARIVREVQEQLEKLAKSGNQEMIEALEPIHKRVLRAHALLVLEGVNLPNPKPLVAKSVPKTDFPNPGDNPSPMPADPNSPSFVAHVAPILNAKCGRCHVQDSKGRFSLATYTALMKGSAGGVVIFPKDASGSRLIEVIEEGDMPRGGAKITPAELDTLKKWITAGAKFDGQDAGASLASLAPNSKPEAAMAPQIKKATGNESISFARDVAPLLTTNCVGCHVNAQRVRGDLNMTTFAGLMKGGESGTPVIPGKPDESLLVKKLLGTAGGERMPVGRAPLSDADMAKITTWIKEGATYDGQNPNDDILTVSRLAIAENSTPEELSASRVEQAHKNWRLGMAGIDADVAETKQFFLLGNIGEATLAQLGQQAEEVAGEVATMFKHPAGQPLTKGKVTLFMLKQRYDYTEFGKMVERRSSLPKSVRGHWGYNVVDAYAAIIAPRPGENSFKGQAAQQLAGVYIASLSGKVPRWFAEGSARVAASRLAKDDERVKQWDEDLGEALQNMDKSTDFMEGKLNPEMESVVAYSFVKNLMRDSKRFDGLLGKMRQGHSFDKAFKDSFGRTPMELAQSWKPAAPRRRR